MAKHNGTWKNPTLLIETQLYNDVIQPASSRWLAYECNLHPWGASGFVKLHRQNFFISTPIPMTRVLHTYERQAVLSSNWCQDQKRFVVLYRCVMRQRSARRWRSPTHLPLFGWHCVCQHMQHRVYLPKNMKQARALERIEWIQLEMISYGSHSVYLASLLFPK